MSLNKFLAVGQSFAGIRGEKSPFEMGKDRVLPKFEAAPRFAKPHSAGPEMVQSDWLQNPPASAPHENAEGQSPAVAAPAPQVPAARKVAGKPIVKSGGKRWLRWLTFGLLGRAKPESRLVQGEMTLENVRVLRNDLADSDLELVLKKKRPARRIIAEPVHAPVKRQWNELSARLFEIGQQ